MKKLGGRASWRAIGPASPCSMSLGGSLALPIPAGFEFFHTFLVTGSKETALVATTNLLSNSSWVCPPLRKSPRRATAVAEKNARRGYQDRLPQRPSVTNALRLVRAKAITIASSVRQCHNLKKPMKTRLFTVLIVLGTSVPGWAQELGEAARQEQTRRSQIKSLGKVYTNQDLRKYRTLPEPSSGSSATRVPIQSSTGGSVPLRTWASSLNSEERLWSKRFIEARARLQAAQKRHEMLQARLNQLNWGFMTVGCGDGAACSGYDPYYTIQTKQQMENNQKELRAAEQALEDLREQLRKSGNPRSWENSQLALEPAVKDKIAEAPKVKDQSYWREELVLLDKRYNAVIEPLQAELFELVHLRPAREGESTSTTGELGLWFPPYVHELYGHIKELKQQREQAKVALAEKGRREGALPGWFR
ncbi:MAG: hypothetical protein DMG05_08010 [Acidobacteria bacterium]|nr:MAG: hypothetical protein DMG05_08010 [Acidobacteriota bacterium]